MRSDLLSRASRSLRRRWSHAHSNARIRRLNREIAAHAPAASGRPVVFFNASTRLGGVSLNAAYSLISRWAVQMVGAPVINFACRSGLSRCVLGTNRDNVAALPPCASCIAQSEALYARSQVEWLIPATDERLEKATSGLTLSELMALEYQDAPLGALILPSIRWVLRRHHLVDDEQTRWLYREYIHSAWQTMQQFDRLLEKTNPRAVVVFNGMFYPEAAARWAAQRRGLPVISHEVGLRPYTAFFTLGDAPAYPIHIADEFDLNERQNKRLDEYLGKRIQGNFSMAGIRFWPEMRRLSAEFLDRVTRFRQVAPVFTNVIFDTSQPHSNVVFPHMFAWLDSIQELARGYPDTLFVIRAHPDESRPGKASRESVADWVREKQILDFPNVIFIPPDEYISSYELIQLSKFVMVYNSTIGLEASLMGAAVLCGGRARFTQIPTVFFPGTAAEYLQTAREFLEAERVAVPDEFKRNARRFLYYQLYRTSLPFDAWIEEDDIWQGYVRFKDLHFDAFDPNQSQILRIVVDGILHGKEFLLNE